MEDFEVLNRLFTSRIRTKLLKFLLTMPESSYFVRELERKIGEDAKNISRELQNLEQIGLLTSEKRGNQKFYAVKETFLYFPELKALFLKSSGLHGLFRETLSGLFGVERVFMKEIASADEESLGLIKLVVVGRPDTAVLNDAVNSLMDKINRDIVYRCYNGEEFEERWRMEDPYIIEVAAGEKIL